MSFQSQLEDIQNGKQLGRDDAAVFLGYILDDETVSDEQIAETLTALTKTTLTADELSGFIDAMRARMTRIEAPDGAIDTCGTGGDKSGTFNISTASAILTAAGGVSVAKHGNRAATSKCGSADVLEALGIPVDLSPEAASDYLKQNGFVFLFAPLYHPSLKRLAIVRKRLGFPTVFNLLGPLLNPASVSRQVIGTYSLSNAELLAEVASRMGYEHVIVLCSRDGLDEASLSAPVDIFEVKQDKVTRSTVSGSDYGLEAVKATELIGGDAGLNAKMIVEVMRPSKQLSSQQRVVVFNAGIAFYVAGRADSIAKGVELAQETLLGGKGALKLNALSGEIN